MKIFKTILSIMILSLLFGCGGQNGSQSIKQAKIEESFIGNNISDVVARLSELGFSDINEVVIDDLTSQSEIDEGYVEKVYFDGVSNYELGTSFPVSSSVSVVYHIVQRKQTPVSSDNLQNQSLEELENKFIESGFVNVETSELYDLDPDAINSSYVNEVTINNKSSFVIGDSFPYDKTVSIIRHYPYNKYDVNLHLNFIGNWLFSKYDVNFYLDDELIEKIPHGTDKDYQWRLKEGDYKLRFEESGDSKVFGEYVLKAVDNLDGEISISCYNDRVSVDEKEIKYETYLRDNETRLDHSKGYYLGKKYTDVVSAFEQLGFSDVSTNIIYDLENSSDLKRETVSDVSIGKKESFNSGEIYDKSEKVVIDYHMSNDDKPEEMVIKEAKDSLPLSQAKRAFENYGNYLYPYGFKCHWILGNHAEEQYDDGSWALIVDVTITNQYNAKVEATAAGYIDNTAKAVTYFDVYDIH